jgi:GNAT superfamily N-acetyltransferase
MELDDGRAVLLRPVVPEDRERVRNAIAGMSRESRYRRFFSSIVNPSDDLLRYFTEVDQHNHVAWGALDPSAEGQPGIGIARFIRDRERPNVAEVAFAVRDDLQGHGLGTLLLAVLYLVARSRGIDTFRAVVLDDNYGVIDWLSELGANGKLRDGVMEFELAVRLDYSPLQETRAADHFGRRLREVSAKLGANG